MEHKNIEEVTLSMHLSNPHGSDVTMISMEKESFL
jgi:hypothetical protein